LNREKKNERRPGFNVGSASIIMVFSVLCLTIFAVLSVVTANSDLNLTRRASSAIQDFYTAEYRAETRALSIKEAMDNGADADAAASGEGAIYDASSGTISYTEAVDHRRELRVTLLLEDGALSINNWILTVNDNWNPDNALPVWPGE
jgi:hypothetical protein